MCGKRKTMHRKHLKKKVVIGEKYWFTTFGIEFEVEITKPANMETNMCEVKYIKVLNESEPVKENIYPLLSGIQQLIANQTSTSMWVNSLRIL